MVLHKSFFYPVFTILGMEILRLGKCARTIHFVFKTGKLPNLDINLPTDIQVSRKSASTLICCNRKREQLREIKVVGDFFNALF
jgi:hypothetical protein